MNNNAQTELLQILESMCSATLEPQQESQLNCWLRESAKARQLYLDYLDVHLGLADYARREPFIFSLCSSDSDLAETLPTEAMAPGANNSKILRPHPASNGMPLTSPSRARTYLWSAAISASLLMAIGIRLFLVSPQAKESESSGIIESRAKSELIAATTAGRSTDQNARPEALVQPLYVAQVSNLTDDVQWGDKASSREFLLRLRRGDRIDISAGLVQIEYFSGAKIILHGPCVFVPTSNNSGRLESGLLTGNVRHGDFLLTTPSAKVIDLGTEFGVAVDRGLNTDVCVFDGKVKVVAGRQTSGSDDSLLLNQGMAARVRNNRGIEALSDLDPHQFVRKLPAIPNFGVARNEVSLVDLISGYDGQNFRLAGVIAPDTGESDRHPWLRSDGPGYSMYRGYQQTEWHPYIDGVFIPSNSGENLQLDSTNHRVDLPSSTGRTWGPIWSRRRFAAVSSAQQDFWGTGTLKSVIAQLEKAQTGMIGIHSNVGITFDLAAISRQFGKTPVSFHGIVSNLENSQQRHPEWAASKRFSADMRIFVDGELRQSRLDFNRVDGESTLEVKLASRDRFLTIVTTDAGKDEFHNHDAYDHVVLIDPVLVLAR